jgi:uncharacterized protein involved in exopolysaccharide biosynthesis
VPNSRLVEIAFSAADPELAARVTNSYADNFINSNLERRYEASAYARSFLERQIVNVKRDLERSERQLVSYAQSQGIINMVGRETSDSGSLQGASLAALNAALAEAQTRRIAAEQAFRQNRAAGQTAEVAASTAGLRTQRAGLRRISGQAEALPSRNIRTWYRCVPASTNSAIRSGPKPARSPVVVQHAPGRITRLPFRRSAPSRPRQ